LLDSAIGDDLEKATVVWHGDRVISGELLAVGERGAEVVGTIVADAVGVAGKVGVAGGVELAVGVGITGQTDIFAPIVSSYDAVTALK